MGMGSANDKRRYYLTPSAIGQARTQNDPWRGVFVISTPNLGICIVLLYDFGLEIYICVDFIDTKICPSLKHFC